jgi:hypothetical protein
VAGVGGSTGVLGESDFSYLGSFRLPTTQANGSGSIYNFGITIRYVGATAHLLTIGKPSGGPGELLDYTVPTLKTSAYNTAPLVKNWGDPYGGLNVDSTGSGSDMWYVGIYWDPTDSRLYWTYRNPYAGTASQVENPFFGYSTLSDGTGLVTPVGSWRVVGDRWGSWSETICRIPTAFADTYLGGKCLGMFCGGAHSTTSISGNSAGPSACAIDPADLPATQGSAIAKTILIDYPAYIEQFADRPPNRMVRPAGLPTLDERWDDFGWGNGYWQEHDVMHGGLWIDTGTKQGVLFDTVWSSGLVQYIWSVPQTECMNLRWCIYDPADIAQIVQGTVNGYDVQPSSVFEPDVPDGFLTQSPMVVDIAATASSLTASGTLATFTSVGHGLTNNGTQYALVGANQAGYNLGFRMSGDPNTVFMGSVIDANTIQIRLDSSPTSPATGGPFQLRTLHTNGAEINPLPFFESRLAFDGQTNRLYVARVQTPGSYDHMQVDVYQVGS